VRWLESIIPADETDIVVWSADPDDAAVFDLPRSLRQDMLARLEERVGRGMVEIVEDKTA
jgi:hypothetical protein